MKAVIIIGGVMLLLWAVDSWVERRGGGRMPKRNRCTYVCADCRERQVRWRGEFTRCTRPRCVACGSLAIEPVPRSVAHERDASGTTASRDQKTRTWTM